MQEGEVTVITIRQASIHSNDTNVTSTKFPTQKYSFLCSNVPIKNSKCLGIQEYGSLEPSVQFQSDNNHATNLMLLCHATLLHHTSTALLREGTCMVVPYHNLKTCYSHFPNHIEYKCTFSSVLSLAHVVDNIIKGCYNH